MLEIGPIKARKDTVEIVKLAPSIILITVDTK